MFHIVFDRDHINWRTRAQGTDFLSSTRFDRLFSDMGR